MTSSDEPAVRASFNGFGTALDSGDLEVALDWCTDEFVFIGQGDGEETVGKAAVPAMFEALSPHVHGLQFSPVWDSIEIGVLGDLAGVLAWSVIQPSAERYATSSLAIVAHVSRQCSCSSSRS